MEIKLKLNGKLIAGQAEADTVLLDFLRERGCFSVKRGCFSSGAASIWSKSYSGLRSGYSSCSTLEMAAVRVVLP